MTSPRIDSPRVDLSANGPQ